MKTKKVAFLGISVALAMVFSFLETLIPPLVAIPGIKIGLANLVIVVLLYKFDFFMAFAVSLVRIILSSILFGNVQVFAFSLAGGALSLLGMLLLKKLKFSHVTVSVVGGVLHNLGQIAVAVLWTQTPQIVFYLPILMISGTVAGAVIGILSAIFVKRLEKLKI